MPDGIATIDPDRVARRIDKLLAERRTGAVKPLLAALAKLSPDHQGLALLRAGYWCQMRDTGEALAVLAEAISRQPDNAALWLRMAEIHFDQGSFDDAVRSAAQALLLAPESGAAKSRLGLALLQLGQLEQALPCLTESFAANPADAQTALALAALSPAAAIDILTRAIAANPRLAVLQNALIRLHLRHEQTTKAMRVARRACAGGIADAQTHCLLAFAWMSQENWDEAVISAARAQSIAPEDRWAARLRAALSAFPNGRLPDVVAEPAEIAGQVLVAGGTIAPGAFRTLIQDSGINGPVLDLYCGTGLNAIAARGLGTGPWSGVDPSLTCIERCTEHGIYATLEQSDPLQAFATAHHGYAVILLNEALAYHACAQSWLNAIRIRLGAGGIALAAIPTGRPGLNGHGLFAHAPADIAREAAAAGLAFTTARTGVLRFSEGLPVHGVIASFRAA